MKSKYRQGIFCVCYRKKKNFLGKEKILYLILKRKLHWKGWEFPKGGIKPKENLIKTVVREIKEETGQRPFNIQNYNIRGKYKYDKKIQDRKNILGQTFTLFSAELKLEKIKIRKEHSGYKWVDYDKAIKLLTWPNQKMCLDIVDKNI